MFAPQNLLCQFLATGMRMSQLSTVPGMVHGGQGDTSAQFPSRATA